MKKTILFVLALALVGSMVAGCSSGGDAAGGDAKKPAAADEKK